MFTDAIGRLLPPAISGSDRNERKIWSELAEAGVLALGIPESAQGLGGGMAETGMVMRAVGSSLARVPYLSTVALCGWLLSRLNGEQASDRLGTIAAGDLKLSLAHYEPGAGYSDGPMATRVKSKEGREFLHGVKAPVLDADCADAFLVSVPETRGGMSLYLVERDAPGLDVKLKQAVDGSAIGTLTMTGAPATLVGAGDAAGDIGDALLRANVAVCAQALGAMEQVIERTREYLKTRRAFGRTLSQFQVLQHRFVDMLIALEETRAVVEAAEAACEVNDGEREIAVRTCKVTTARAARFVSAQGIQLHGGVGMTDELVISHYYKRLMTLEAAFGNGEHHLRLLARLAETKYAGNEAGGVLLQVRAS